MLAKWSIKFTKNITSVCERTVPDYVGKGDTGLTPTRAGQKLYLPSNVGSALEVVMHPYIQIKCLLRESQPTRKTLIQMLKASLQHGGKHYKSWANLHDLFQISIAGQV